ncbi:MAG: STAS domain-containing protein [Planctomycetes bacterium]|nr:STAS domain-containing protein [Planctomycetota bacterium]
MDTSIHDDEGFTACIGDSGILFENACGTENLRVTQTGATTVIRFGDRGMRDAACIHTFHDQIRELIAQNQCRVLILDMRGVWFLPSRTLGSLLSLRKNVERIELQNVSDELREGLRVAQLDKLLHVNEVPPEGPGL